MNGIADADFDGLEGSVAGAYGVSGVWVAADTTVNVIGSWGAPDLSETTARYDWTATLAALPSGTETLFIYFGSGQSDAPMALKTPEGYAVYWKDEATDKVFVVKDETTVYQFTKASGTGGNYPDPGNNKPVQSFVAGHQESYEWRKALNGDSDFDGLDNSVEGGSCPTSSSDADSDADGVLDGTEPGWNLDTDLDGKKNALDKDSDNDGIADNLEDANENGRWDAGETDATKVDSDAVGSTNTAPPMEKEKLEPGQQASPGWGQ